MPGVPCKVNIAIDATVGLLTHNLLLPPPVPPPPKLPIVPSIEMITTQMWTAGYLTGQNKFTTTVKHLALPIIQEGHDIGMLIPDVTIPPVNLWYAVMWPLSSRKVMFMSSLVIMNKKAAGCASVVPPFPMMTCGDPISAPTALPVTSWMHTVSVGLTWMDIFKGIGAIVFSMALDYIFDKIGGGGGSGPSSAWGAVGQGILGKLVPTDGKALAKLMLSGLSGVLFPSPTDGPKYEVKVGMPGVLEVGVAASGRETGVGVNAFGGQDNRGGFGASGTASAQYGDS
jgi:hypothetical protein